MSQALADMKGASCGIRIGKDRNVGAAQDGGARRHLRPAHPACQHRLAVELGVRAQMLGGLGGIGHSLGCEDNQQAVAPRIFSHNLHRFRVAVGRSVAQDVNGVIVTPGGGQQLVQLGHRVAREFRELPTAHNQRVSREHAGTAGIGQDGQARALGARLLAEDVGHGEQVANGVHTQHAAAAEGSVEDVVAAGQRPGVRGGGFGGGFGPAGFENNNGLGERHLTGRGEKRAGVADRFHVDDDAARVGVIAQIVDQITPVHVEH